MRDLGLEQLGAQLSLFGRQVASSISAILPAELNPFGPDEEVNVGGGAAVLMAFRALYDTWQPTCHLLLSILHDVEGLSAAEQAGYLLIVHAGGGGV